MAIVYIESNTTGFGQKLLATSCRYDDVYFLTRDPSRYPFLDDSLNDAHAAGIADVDVIQCDTSSLETLSAIVRGIGNVRFVASTSDAYIEIAARLSERLETPGNNAVAVARCRDKLQLQDLFWMAEVPYPRTVHVRAADPGTAPGAASSMSSTPSASSDPAVGSERPTLRDELAELRYPLIVKPRQGTGSIGVRQIASFEAMPDGSAGDLLCQEFIAGQEFSVESFTDANGHQLLGITRKFVSKPPHFLELGHVFPAQLDIDLQERIGRIVCRALDAVGYTFGPAHTEVKVCGGAIYIIEINARLAGGMIPRLMELSYAWSVPDLYIQSYLSGQSQFPAPVLPRSSAVMFIVPEKDRHYIGIDFPEDCEDAGYFRERGVNTGKFDFSDRAGYVIATGRSEIAALRHSIACRRDATVLYAPQRAPVVADQTLSDIVYRHAGWQAPVLPGLKDSLFPIEKAHLLMLLQQRIIDTTQFAALRDALLALEAEPALREAHHSGRGDYYDYEQYMIERCGRDIGGMVQTARSRNDINSTHLALVTREVIYTIGQYASDLIGTLLDKAAQTEQIVLPIYSQFQTAMPGTVGHYLTAQAQTMIGTLSAMVDALSYLQRAALGACAGAGTSFHTDTAITAQWLGFQAGPLNSLHAITDKNDAIRCVYLLCEMSGNLNRSVCDLQLLSMRELGIVTFGDAMYGGSSNMPQKRNPYLLEWLRCAHERNVGRLLSALSSIGHLPSGNSYQASRSALEALTETAAPLSEMLTVSTYAFANAQFSEAASRAAITTGNACATLAAEQLVREGLASFRDAHTRIGNAMTNLPAGKKTPDDTARRLLDGLNDDLSSGAVVHQLIGGGGPAPANTRVAIDVLQTQWLHLRRTLLAHASRTARINDRLNRQFRSAC